MPVSIETDMVILQRTGTIPIPHLHGKADRSSRPTPNGSTVPPYMSDIDVQVLVGARGPRPIIPSVAEGHEYGINNRYTEHVFASLILTQTPKTPNPV